MILSIIKHFSLRKASSIRSLDIELEKILLVRYASLTHPMETFYLLQQQSTITYFYETFYYYSRCRTWQTHVF